MLPLTTLICCFARRVQLGDLETGLLGANRGLGAANLGNGGHDSQDGSGNLAHLGGMDSTVQKVLLGFKALGVYVWASRLHRRQG